MIDLKLKAVHIVVLSALVLPLAYNACQSEPKSKFRNSSSSSTSQCIPSGKPMVAQKAISNRNAFAENKFHVPLSNSGLAAKTTKVMKSLDGQIELLALMKNACLIDALKLPAKQRGISDAIMGETIPDVDREEQMYTYRVNANTNLQSLSNKVNSDPCIIGMGYNYVYEKSSMASVVNDPSTIQQRHLEYLQMEEAFPLIYDEQTGIQNLLSQGKEVVVAVVDTGVNYGHPDLYDQMWRDPSTGYVGINAALLPQRQYLKPCDCVNFDAQNRCTDPIVNNPFDVDSDDSHGTHIAGIIGARVNNGVGGMGIAGSGVKIMAIRIFNTDSERQNNGQCIQLNRIYATTRSTYEGVVWAVDHGADVVNLSLELTVTPNQALPDSLLEEAIQYAVNRDVFVAVAAGNSHNGDASKEIDETTFSIYPAILGKYYEGVMSVGALDILTNDRSKFSHYSTDYVEIGAPGSEDHTLNGSMGGIYSTDSDDGYKRLQGTSMAVPMVSAVAAIVKGLIRQNANTEVSAAELERIIANSAAREGSLSDDFKEGRALSINRSVKKTYLDYAIPTQVELNSCP